jgi:hypothetical protein
MHSRVTTIRPGGPGPGDMHILRAGSLLCCPPARLAARRGRRFPAPRTARSSSPAQRGASRGGVRHRTSGSGPLELHAAAGAAGGCGAQRRRPRVDRPSTASRVTLCRYGAIFPGHGSGLPRVHQQPCAGTCGRLHGAPTARGAPRRVRGAGALSAARLEPRRLSYAGAACRWNGAAPQAAPAAWAASCRPAVRVGRPASRRPAEQAGEPATCRSPLVNGVQSLQLQAVIGTAGSAFETLIRSQASALFVATNMAARLV